MKQYFCNFFCFCFFFFWKFFFIWFYFWIELPVRRWPIFSPLHFFFSFSHSVLCVLKSCVILLIYIIFLRLVSTQQHHCHSAVFVHQRYLNLLQMNWRNSSLKARIRCLSLNLIGGDTWVLSWSLDGPPGLVQLYSFGVGFISIIVMQFSWVYVLYLYFFHFILVILLLFLWFYSHKTFLMSPLKIMLGHGMELYWFSSSILFSSGVFNCFIRACCKSIRSKKVNTESLMGIGLK